MIVTLSGNLVYLRNVLGNWDKKTVLDSRSESKKINNIKLVKINGRLHAFYSIEYDGRMMLVHHISFDDEFNSKPVVIDYISIRSIFHISVDSSFNIHIVYADEDSQIKYTTFINSSKSYSANKVNCEDKIRSINTVFFGNELYCTYLSKEKDYNVINCLRFSDNEKRTVGFGVDMMSEPCIFSFKDTLYIEWREKGYAFECSADRNFRFSKPFSIGISEKTLKLRSFTNEAVSFIDKCVANIYKRPFSSAKNVFERLSEKEKPAFKIKGSEVTAFQKESLGNSEINDNRLCIIEEQLKSLIKIVELIADAVLNRPKTFPRYDVGNINEENLEKFNKLDVVNSLDTNSITDEYIENKEE